MYIETCTQQRLKQWSPEFSDSSEAAIRARSEFKAWLTGFKGQLSVGLCNDLRLSSMNSAVIADEGFAGNLHGRGKVIRILRRQLHVIRDLERTVHKSHVREPAE